MGERLTVMVGHNKGGGPFLDGPRRREAVDWHGSKGQFFAYCAQMPARRLSNEPIAFVCPGCGAIVTIEVPEGVSHSKFGCVKCDALFPVGEGRISLEYMNER